MKVTESTNEVVLSDVATVTKSSEVPLKVVDGKVIKTTTLLET